MLRYAIEIIGWLAAALMLCAYLLLTMGKLNARSNLYQWFYVLSGGLYGVFERSLAGSTMSR